MMARALVLAAVVVAACSRREAEPAAAPAAGPAVTLERTPCFGTCPVYTVAISRSGEVTFDGKRHVAHTGQATATIPRSGWTACWPSWRRRVTSSSRTHT